MHIELKMLVTRGKGGASRQELSAHAWRRGTRARMHCAASVRARVARSVSLSLKPPSGCADEVELVGSGG
jgi:hypothetical protein